MRAPTFEEWHRGTTEDLFLACDLLERLATPASDTSYALIDRLTDPYLIQRLCLGTVSVGAQTHAHHFWFQEGTIIVDPFLCTRAGRTPAFFVNDLFGSMDPTEIEPFLPGKYVWTTEPKAWYSPYVAPEYKQQSGNLIAAPFSPQAILYLKNRYPQLRWNRNGQRLRLKDLYWLAHLAPCDLSGEILRALRETRNVGFMPLDLQRIARLIPALGPLSQAANF